MANIGFVGLGHMGLPMAINLIKAGHQVTGFDLQHSALEALVEAGGRIAHTLGEAAIDQQIIITMLQTGQQVHDVCLREGGLYDNAKRCLHIDCSTIDVNTSRDLHQQALARQIMAIDAPVSGGVSGAAAGTLTFMVGGESHSLEKATPFLQVMGKKIIHAGDAGSGQAAKICNNMVLGISMIAVSEAFVLAEQLGLAADKLHEVVSNASGQCWVTNNYLPVPGVLPNVPANNHYQPGFTTSMMLKDLRLSQQAAQSAQVETTLGEMAMKSYQQFSEEGYGDLDFSAIIKTVKHV